MHFSSAAPAPGSGLLQVYLTLCTKRTEPRSRVLPGLVVGTDAIRAEAR